MLCRDQGHKPLYAVLGGADPTRIQSVDTEDWQWQQGDRVLACSQYMYAEDRGGDRVG